MLIILVVLLIILTKFIIKPLYHLLQLKIQYGEKAVLNFIPFIGDVFARQVSYKKYGDDQEYKKKLISEDPNRKFLLTNDWDKVFIIIFDHNYYKEFYINHQALQKYDLIGHNEFLFEGLLFTQGEKWTKQRRLLSQCFTFNKLKSTLPLMNQVAKNQCEKQISDIHLFTSLITSEIVVKAFFGSINHQLLYKNKPIALEIIRLLVEVYMLKNRNLIVSFKISLLGQLSWKYPIFKKESEFVQDFKELKSFVYSLIQQKRESQQSNQTFDFLDALINDCDSNEISQQFFTLVFAGTHTTSVTCAFCLYYLAKNPQAQDELLSEIKEVIGDKDVEEDTINKLHLISAFINETLRLRNPAFQPIRRFVKQDMTIRDLHIKKGWIIVPATDVSVINNNLIDNPLTFNYKRWLNQPVFKQDSTFIYVPFAAGARNCIGQHMAQMELKVMLVHLIRKYRVELNPEVNVTFPLKFTYTIEPTNFVKLIKR